MLPVAVADSTSPSPAKVPPVNATVALISFRLSGSETVTLGDSVTGERAFSVNDALVVPASVGASLTAVTPMVVVAMLLDALPSLTTHVTWRVLLAPKLSGLSLEDRNE